ncbi:hypothetical protein EKO27_g10158 [Xylaria grammica]|uniref:RING-type domain-containing protein n=1 Tax=Xylaria grammica TaxID=363999 RepID=A0A439CS11_9PEZI|nr:hypothetical protein EKO27_g10158 [Xylaria grammica]
MPIVRFPKVKLGFLKKLLHSKSESEAVTEPSPDGPSNQHDEKAILQDPPLEECPICHDPVGVTNPEGILESWVHLHCNHKFGTNCIQTWLQESAERDPHSIPSCPICRTTAKHPCGHPVILPAPRLSPFNMWPPSPPSPPPAHIEGRRPRRRLSRRLGHPHRPLPPRVERAHVQTVGKCNTCAATAAAQEKRMRQMTTPSVETGGPAYSGRGRSGDRQTRIKSMLLQTSFRRLSISTLESPREAHSTFIETLGTPGDRPTPVALREYTNLCRTPVTVARSPTPAPAIHRVSSF